jgi:hypothetical protein
MCFYIENQILDFINESDFAKIFQTLPMVRDIVRSVYYLDIARSMCYLDTSKVSLHEFYEDLIRHRHSMFQPAGDVEYEKIIKLIFTKLCHKKEDEFIMGG